MKRHYMNTLLGVLLAASVAACEDDVTAVPPEAVPHVVGSYALERVNGALLPAVVFEGNVADAAGDYHLRVVATHGAIDLYADSSYWQRVQHSVYINGALVPGMRWADYGVFQARADSVRFASDLPQGFRFTAVRNKARLDMARDHIGRGRSAQYTYVRLSYYYEEP